jgi:hypothetical protein
MTAVKEKEDFTIFNTVPVRIRTKCWHIHKIGKRCHRDFTSDYGDIPVARFNHQTGFWEHVVNRRGFAYAARNRMKYRNKAKHHED